ncbi:MAG: xanthine dehydrogenase accessory protein XdhC [Elusimicrobia bacterium]|nr:xanthine dehydrogenase accessory protein XdhC [Elusimicrobiota bacterium]
MEPLALSELAGDLPRPGVLCTLAKVVGSAPQSPGAKMWVWSDGFSGTIGGGRFEALVLAEARRLLEASRPEAFLKEYTLCREMGQCCGGKATIFFEPCGRRKAVHIFGAGHVARALASTLDGLDLEVVVYDARPEWADPAAFPPKARILRADPVVLAQAAGYGPLDAACVMTNDHELDFNLIDLLLDKPLGYLGLIGSMHKARVFRSRLPPPRRALWDDRMRCPIGRKIPSKNPKAIAVSVAAELLEKWAYRCAAAKAKADAPA